MYKCKQLIYMCKTLAIDLWKNRKTDYCIVCTVLSGSWSFRIPLHSSSSVWRSWFVDHGGGYPLRLMASHGGFKSLFCCFCGSKRRFQKLQVWECYIFFYVCAWLICSQLPRSKVFSSVMGQTNQIACQFGK